jgi:2-polyprenyl-6-methoxyphenol hydroxylase-like FAD-dependent oxidoreductase
MKTAVVIGAGLSGLASSIFLKRIAHFDKIYVLEKRLCHSRENFVLLSSLGTQRLKQLGIYEEWIKQRHTKQVHPHFYQNICIRGNINGLVEFWKQSGKLPKDGPSDVAHLKCSQAIPTLHQNTTFQDVLDCQDNGKGIEMVRIKDLEMAMAKIAKSLNVELIYGADVIYDVSSYGISSVHVNRIASIQKPDVVVICEGAKRSVSKDVLDLKEIRASYRTKHILCQVDKYFDSTVYLANGVTDSDFPDAQFNHLVCPNVNDQDSSFIFIELPAIEDQSDELIESIVTRQINQVTELHHLPKPKKILWKSKPFYSQESYLPKPWFGSNTLIIGDAARAGSYGSGTGFNLALVNDISALGNFVSGEKNISDSGQTIAAASKFFHELNLSRFYHI